MEKSRKSIHSEIAIYARSAFAIGYSRHLDVVTDEAKADCLDAMRYAIEHMDDLNVMQVVEQMGSLSGMKAQARL